VLKFPTFKMWKAVSSEENYYSSPLLDTHRFVHEMPTLSSRGGRTRGKRVTSFSELAEFGVKRASSSESNLHSRGQQSSSAYKSFYDEAGLGPGGLGAGIPGGDEDGDDDMFRDVQNEAHDTKGELTAFLQDQISELQLKQEELQADAASIQADLDAEKEGLDAMQAEVQVDIHIEDEHHSMYRYADHDLNRARRASSSSLQVPQFQNDEVAKAYFDQFSKVEHLDRKLSDANDRLSRVEAEIDALREEIEWMDSSKQGYNNNPNVPTPPDGRFDMELVDCTLSTMLSANPIQQHLTIRAWLELPKPLEQWGSGMYSDTYN
jgi:peptidoglycan hydrolase CwlO-like protein